MFPFPSIAVAGVILLVVLLLSMCALALICLHAGDVHTEEEGKLEIPVPLSMFGSKKT